MSTMVMNIAVNKIFMMNLMTRMTNNNFSLLSSSFLHAPARMIPVPNVVKTILTHFLRPSLWDIKSVMLSYRHFNS